MHRRTAAAMACLLACGCSVARELPRGEYAARPERKNVEVDTRSGDKYVFETARIAADSLHGRSRLDQEGPFEEYRSVSLPLDDVQRISIRTTDWYRTGLVIGVGAAIALAAVLSREGSGGNGSGSGCPRCP